MKGVFFLGAALALGMIGFWNPIVFALGYIWADIVAPNRIAPYALGWISLPMVFGLLVLLFLPNAIIRGGPRWNWTSSLLLVHGIWMTLSLIWAVHQGPALFQWEFAIKAVLFALILPWFLRGRASVEAMVWTLVLCVALHAAPYGLKFVLGGGGYQQSLGLIADNSNYAESSTLAMLAISIMPLVWFLMRHQSVFKNQQLVRYGAIAGTVLLALSMAGTYARTGLVCLAALIAILTLQNGQRGVKIVLGLLSILCVYLAAPEQWFDRMYSIDDTTDRSSMGRVAVWKWTLEYVAAHPLGGGFGIWRSSQFNLPLLDGSEIAVQGKAFHSVYFEVLGSLGYPGFIIYTAWIASSLLILRKISKDIGLGPENAWINDLARSLIIAMLVFLTGGIFIGVAFQSYPLYLAAISIALAGIARARSKDDGRSAA